MPAPDPRALLSARAVRDLLGVSAMTVHRWQADPALAFPRHVAVVQGRRFYLKRDIEEFIDKLIATTANGVRTTRAPDPRRRRAAKNRAEGMATG
jgi:hypothetical protein